MDGIGENNNFLTTPDETHHCSMGAYYRSPSAHGQEAVDVHRPLALCAGSLQTAGRAANGDGKYVPAAFYHYRHDTQGVGFGDSEHGRCRAFDQKAEGRPAWARLRKVRRNRSRSVLHRAVRSARTAAKVYVQPNPRQSGNPLTIVQTSFSGSATSRSTRRAACSTRKVGTLSHQSS